ncbi:30S ribosomal protein S14 [endosymbiont of Euscepes postfasciatus]|uniref:30S ribosomal protein S14 n=1 Tax=endosymbiont of Euscepes postfasciatus TaxID=650377 RepID=UPI000DC73DCE|nr:30S ribosomal protein S14 [endosymbiont of Euscepes postfasciatus]BBA84680.1 30S ribosomal protein S14 [endosymbiont of Euscepes postfasciatus]
MTKKSIIFRNNKRILLYNKYYKKRLYLKKIISNKNIQEKERWESMLKLQKLPKNSCKIRIRNRCYITGRSRSYLRRFGLSRIKLREMAMLGLIPGLKKSSW